MSTTGTAISGFGVKFPDIKIGFSDDKEYYEMIGCDIWDEEFVKRGLDVVLGYDRVYVGIFKKETTNLSFDYLHFNFERTFDEIQKEYEEAKYAFYKFFEEHPEYSYVLEDVRDIKMLNMILYS